MSKLRRMGMWEDAHRNSNVASWPRVTDKKTPLPYPHYSQACWDAPGGRPVYGNPDSAGAGHSYDYDDRLVQWDRDKHAQAVEAADASHRPSRSVAWWEVYLTTYYDEPRKIDCVMAGVNRGNGYAWFAFAHRKIEAEQ